jgi:hypothetical protein
MSSVEDWRLVHGWPILKDVPPDSAFPQFTLPRTSWKKIQVWDAGVGGSQYLLLIVHRRAFTIELLKGLTDACKLADMWYVVEPSFEMDGVMAVITSFHNEFYS